MEAFFVIPKAQSTTDVDALFDHEANFCSKLNGMIIIIAVIIPPIMVTVAAPMLLIIIIGGAQER